MKAYESYEHIKAIDVMFWTIFEASSANQFATIQFFRLQPKEKQYLPRCTQIFQPK